MAETITRRLDYIHIAPAGARAFGGFYGYIMQSGLPAELVEFVYPRISQINNSAHWIDANTRDLTARGVPMEKIALVQNWAECGRLFSETERAALAWTEVVMRAAQTGVPDEAYQAARAIFREKELVDLTIAVTLMSAYNHMAIAFRNPPYPAIKK